MTSKAPGKAVAKKEDNSISTNEMPDFMKNYAQEGLEGLSESDYVLPRVKLMQATDDAVQTGDVGAGEFFHIVAQEKLGKEIRIIPCFFRKRYMLFRPNDGASQGSGSNILARSDDGIHWSPANAEFKVKLKGKKEEVTWRTAKTVQESKLDAFGSSDPDDPQSKPAATLIYDVICLLPDHPELSPAVISMKGSAISKAKKWVSGLRYSRTPIFGLLFSMYGSLEKNGTNSYWAYNVRGEGFVKSEELVKQGKDLYELAKAQSFVVAGDDESDDDVAGTPGTESKEY